MQQLAPLISLGYWLNLYPPPLVPAVFTVLGIVLSVLFLAGVAAKVWGYRSRKNPPLHRILSRVGRAAITVALVGGAFYFFTYEQLYLLSARFWWILIVIGAVVWKAFIFRDFLSRYPADVRAREARIAKDKYLPR